LHGLRHVGRNAHLAAGLVVLPELGPLQLLLARRCELFRTHVRARHAVLESDEDRHHGVARKDPVAQYLTLRWLGEELNADLAPGLAYQFEHVRFLAAFARGLDDDLKWPSIGQPPYAISARF